MILEPIPEGGVLIPASEAAAWAFLGRRALDNLRPEGVYPPAAVLRRLDELETVAARLSRKRPDA